LTVCDGDNIKLPIPWCGICLKESGVIFNVSIGLNEPNERTKLSMCSCPLQNAPFNPIQLSNELKGDKKQRTAKYQQNNQGDISDNDILKMSTAEYN
jgi:hypothetical protein